MSPLYIFFLLANTWCEQNDCVKDTALLFDRCLHTLAMLFQYANTVLQGKGEKKLPRVSPHQILSHTGFKEWDYM